MGSRTPPWLHHGGPFIKIKHTWNVELAAAVVFLPVLLLRVGGSLMNGWMWRSVEAEAINRRAPRSKGVRTGPRTSPSHSLMLLGQLLTCSLMHVSPWHRLLHGLDKAPCRASFNIFCLGPWSFPASCFGPWAIWSHVHEVSLLVPGFMIFSWSAWWTYPESLVINVNFLRKLQTPKSSCESVLDTSRGLVPLVRVLNTCKCWR
jgi:hypothetical protein